ncbi:MAG: hypothetical protein EOP86_22740 [Verrucomicrobiaceae bacterium]|nr:MAG: hypothetical protein EOP86_22740 [Verrucomicrobiaceae bacterium]
MMSKGFKVLPKRWIACGCLCCPPAVERTFGWIIQSRCLVRDYEAGISHSESMIHISMIKRMLARIAR